MEAWLRTDENFVQESKKFKEVYRKEDSSTVKTQEEKAHWINKNKPAKWRHRRQKKRPDNGNRNKQTNNISNTVINISDVPLSEEKKNSTTKGPLVLPQTFAY